MGFMCATKVCLIVNNLRVLGEAYSGLFSAKPYAGGGCILRVAGSVEELSGL